MGLLYTKSWHSDSFKKWVIFTNFSATCDLDATKLDNSSQDAHAVLTIFVMCNSPHFITVKQEGEDVKNQINDCDVWYFYGDTISKGKKNDTYFIKYLSQRDYRNL